MTDIFADPQATPKLDDFVGEGKKYSDTDAVAKAIVEKDRFIARLLEEKRVAEQTIQERLNVQAYNDRIAALEAAQVERGTPTPPPTATPAPQPVGIDEAAIQRMLDERDRQQVRTRNLMQVKDKLTEVYGADYPNRVKARAQELSVDMPRLNEMAAETPVAFFALLGLDRQANATDSAPPATRQNSAAAFAPSAGSKKNNAYYLNMMRTKPGEYFTPRIASEEFAELTRQGPAFYEP